VVGQNLAVAGDASQLAGPRAFDDRSGRRPATVVLCGRVHEDEGPLLPLDRTVETLDADVNRGPAIVESGKQGFDDARAGNVACESLLEARVRHLSAFE
jgi:hypothetical protein